MLLLIKEVTDKSLDLLSHSRKHIGVRLISMFTKILVKLRIKELQGKIIREALKIALKLSKLLIRIILLTWKLLKLRLVTLQSKLCSKLPDKSRITTSFCSSLFQEFLNLLLNPCQLETLNNLLLRKSIN